MTYYQVPKQPDLAVQAMRQLALNQNTPRWCLGVSVGVSQHYAT